MTEMMYTIKIEATGEIRDAEGNLIETIPVEGTREVTESELIALLAESHQNLE
jgi:hypothetical protein